MTITELCHNKIVAVDSQCSIQAAAKVMKDNNVGDVLVVRNQKPVGILTDRDIVIRLAADAIDLDLVTVGNVMSEDLVVFDEHADIKEAIDTMAEKGVRRAPIINAAGTIIGITSVDDLLILLADELNKISKLLQKQIH